MASTTQPGYVNRNGQVVVQGTGLPGNDALQDTLPYLFSRVLDPQWRVDGSKSAAAHCSRSRTFTT